MSRKVNRKLKEKKKRKARNRSKAELLQRNAVTRRDVVKFDHPILLSSTLDVKDKEYLEQINEKNGFDLLWKLKRTVVAFKNGAGLSANQIAQPYKVSVVRFDTKRNESFIMINPEITEHSEETETEIEGCLSFPGYYTKIDRFKTITVEYLDEEFREQTANYSGYKARVIQHEMDHLSGSPSLLEYYKEKKSKERK